MGNLVMADGEVSLRDHLDGKIDTLERHLDARMLDLERRLTDKIIASSEASAAANEVAKQAVDKAETAVERRLEGLNELREMVSDYQRILMPRSEAEARHDAMEERIKKLEDRDVQEGGHAKGLAAGWGYLVGAAGLIALIVSIYVSLR